METFLLPSDSFYKQFNNLEEDSQGLNNLDDYKKYKSKLNEMMNLLEIYKKNTIIQLI